MSEPRLAAGLLARALIRRVAAAGGNGTVIAKGDETAGAILLIASDRGVFWGYLERALGGGSRYGWVRTGPESTQNQDVIKDYGDRRRRADPDLWLLELDIAGVERFAAELIAQG